MNKKRWTNKQIDAALKATGGKVSQAATKLGMSLRTIYGRIEREPKLREAMNRAREELVDLAETKLLEAVAAGEAWAVCFALKCQGKSRGYVERQAVEHSGQIDTGPQEVRVIVDDNWYGNKNRIAALLPTASGDGASLPSPTQNSGVRETMGKNGNGSNGNGTGPRADTGGNGRSH